MNMDSLKNKTIGILGMGYIGVNLLEFLQTRDINMNIITIDRKNISLLEEIEFDYLINCSGNSGDFRGNLIQTIDSNLGLNTHILEKVKIKETYIYLSSSRIYGFSENKNIVFSEKSVNCYDNLELDFIYDGSKKLAESLLFNFSKNLNYNIAILRLSNVYGKFNTYDDSTLIKKIIRYKNEKKDNLNVNENRMSTKDYIHIDDALECIINIMINTTTTNVYNVSYGESYSLNDISNFLDMKIDTSEKIPPRYSNISNDKMIKEFNITLKRSFENKIKQG